MAISFLPPLDPSCKVDVMREQACSPQVDPAPWVGIAVALPDTVRVDSPADLNALFLPCFVTVARMSGADDAPLMLRYPDPVRGPVEVRVEREAHHKRPLARALPDEDVVPHHQVMWRSFDLVRFRPLAPGLNEFRLRQGSLLSRVHQVRLLLGRPGAG